MKENVIFSHLLRKIIAISAVFLLLGCCKHTNPVTDINDDIQQGAAELVDYANNNMAQDADTKLLIEGVKSCAAKADALTKTCEAQISKCEAQTDKAKAERNTLALVLALLAANAIRKIILRV